MARRLVVVGALAAIIVVVSCGGAVVVDGPNPAGVAGVSSPNDASTPDDAERDAAATGECQFDGAACAGDCCTGPEIAARRVDFAHGCVQQQGTTVACYPSAERVADGRCNYRAFTGDWQCLVRHPKNGSADEVVVAEGLWEVDGFEYCDEQTKTKVSTVFDDLEGHGTGQVIWCP